MTINSSSIVLSPWFMCEEESVFRICELLHYGDCRQCRPGNEKSPADAENITRKTLTGRLVSTSTKTFHIFSRDDMMSHYWKYIAVCTVYTVHKQTAAVATAYSSADWPLHGFYITDGGPARVRLFLKEPLFVIPSAITRSQMKPFENRCCATGLHQGAQCSDYVSTDLATNRGALLRLFLPVAVYLILKIQKTVVHLPRASEKALSCEPIAQVPHSLGEGRDDKETQRLAEARNEANVFRLGEDASRNPRGLVTRSDINVKPLLLLHLSYGLQL
ncbi:hypothetical protein F2P81_012994 [Scophthalmus maximus]|uniref:Uncharacterized protein n=1 Tax=Scophthalmus maximus TaxID=52904 RepID=A0A6A4SJ70_SCOMX|nr:hypothetical protein F2P81_012994 [Scophthalmus maximus]